MECGPNCHVSAEIEANTGDYPRRFSEEISRRKFPRLPPELRRAPPVEAVKSAGCAGSSWWGMLMADVGYGVKNVHVSTRGYTAVIKKYA